MIKVVKAITAVLGIMICIAIGVLGYAFYTSREKPQDAEVVEPSMTLVPQPSQVSSDATTMHVNVGDVVLGQPQGSTIQSVNPQGTLLYVTVQGGGEMDRVVVVDMVKRRVVAHISLGKKVMPAIKPKG